MALGMQVGLDVIFGLRRALNLFNHSVRTYTDGQTHIQAGTMAIPRFDASHKFC